MINGLGVLGWGVGGIEAEAAMLGQPVSMLIPEVVGFKLHGKLPAGATATDLVLTVTEMLRKKKVVGKFVEFYGVGLSSLSLADRATIANMAPEYGATMGFFPVDAETLKYLRLQRARRAAGAARRGVLPRRRVSSAPTTRPTRSSPTPSSSISARWSRASPGPSGRRTACRSRSKKMFSEACSPISIRTDASPADAGGTRAHGGERRTPSSRRRSVATDPDEVMARCGTTRRSSSTENSSRSATASVVIAAITSCTNTSNPSRDARRGSARAERGARTGSATKPWVKTSLAPGSKVVTDYYENAGVMRRARAARLQRRRLRLHDVHRQLGTAAAADRRRGRDRASSSSQRCCRAIATSRGASIR